MKTFIIKWNHLTSLDDFYNVIEMLFLKDSDLVFGRNLDAFNDVLYGGFGSFWENEDIQIIWESFENSKKNIKEIDVIEDIIASYEHITFIKK